MEIVTCNFHNYLPLALDIAWARGTGIGIYWRYILHGDRHILTLHTDVILTYDLRWDFKFLRHASWRQRRKEEQSKIPSFLSSQTPVSMTLHSNFLVAPIGTAGEQYYIRSNFPTETGNWWVFARALSAGYFSFTSKTTPEKDLRISTV